MKKILLIEDDSLIRENTAELLELANYKVISAENGKQGIEFAKRDHPDLIISDIIMPELDGLSVLRIVNKNPETSGIPFIFVTGKSDSTDFRTGMNLGADDYLTKPYDDKDLLDVIRIRLERMDILRNGLGSSEWKGEDLKDLESLKNLAKDKKEKLFSKKEHIYREEDFANQLYFILSGKVKCIKTDSYGKDYVTEIYGAGEFFGHLGLFDQPEYHETAIAMEPTRLAIIPKTEFLMLMRQNREIAEKYMELLSKNVREKENRLLQLAYAPVRERVADALLQHVLPLRSPMNRSTVFNISREDLASIVGTTKESLVRMLSEFKREGIIRSEGREIVIMDEARLKRTAIGF
jgi:CRP-like cAMP-binding protein